MATVNHINHSGPDVSQARWIYWNGWSGNHDKRIEDAKCSKCGHVHKTVYGHPSKLSTFCPGCGSIMVKGE